MQYLHQEVGEGWEKEQEEKSVWFHIILFFKRRWQFLPGSTHAEGAQELPEGVA